MSPGRNRYCLSALLALLVLLLPLLLTACGANNAPTANARTTGPTDVTYWTADTTPVDIQAVNQIIAAFNKANPDIHVTAGIVPTQPGTIDLTALMTAVRGGTGPDVYLLDRFTDNQQAAIGLLQDLSRFGAQRLESDYLPFAWKEAQYQGHPYGLPLDTDSRALFYNKDLLRQAGVNPDALSPRHGPLTLDTFERIAFKLNKTDAQGRYVRVGFLPWEDQAFHTTWGLLFGATFVNDKTCQITPTEPAMVRAFRFMYDWSQRMNAPKAQTFSDTFYPVSLPPAQNPFFIGRVAMTLSGDFLLSNIQEYVPKLNYGITYIPLPEGQHTPFTWSGGFSLVMPKGARHPAAAWRFMRFMAGPQGQRIYTKVTTHLPTWRALLNDNSLFSGPHVFFKSILRYAQSRPPLPVGAQLSDAFDAAQQQIVLGAATPLQALHGVYNRVQPQLQAYCPLKK